MLEIRAIYKGEEYRTAQQEKDRYKIYSSKPKKGFQKKVLSNKEEIYFKEVNLEELESIFEIREKGEYKGKQYDIYRKPGNKISLITTDHTSGFEPLSPGEYWKTVDESEVTFTIEKTLIYPKENNTKGRSDLEMLSKLQRAKTYPAAMKKALDETPSIGQI